MRNSRATSSRRKKAKIRDSSSSTGTGIHSDSDTPFLHDDSIEEIVSRLPIKDVLRFKCVSKTAFNLSSNRDFIDKHMKSTCLYAPMIFVTDDYRRPRYLLDKWSESNRKKSKLEKKCHLHPDYCILLSSQDGLIVSTTVVLDSCVQDYFIFNPIYSETFELSVSRPKNYDGAKVMLGVFYRPCVKEYATLWEFTAESSASWSRLRYSYEVLDLCAQSKWRKIEFQFCQYHRSSRNKPLSINGFLYWVCETAECTFGIMVFDTSTEGFDLIPCPDTAPAATYNEENISECLLNGNGILKMVQIFDKEFEYDVNIWALNDHVKKIWSTSQYRIISRIGNSTGCLFQTIRIIALWNEELFLAVEEDDRRHQEILVCNIKLGTTRKFGRRYCHKIRFRSHVMSLAPIKNLKLKVAI